MAWIDAEESSTTSPPVGETTFQGAVPSVEPSEVMSEEYPLLNFSADGASDPAGRKEEEIAETARRRYGRRLYSPQDRELCRLSQDHYQS